MFTVLFSELRCPVLVCSRVSQAILEIHAVRVLAQNFGSQKKLVVRTGHAERDRISVAMARTAEPRNVQDKLVYYLDVAII